VRTSPTPARLAAILDSIQTGILAVDAGGRCEFQNAEASRILGVSGAPLRGRRLDRQLGAEHPAADLLNRALAARRDLTAHACGLRPRLGGSALVVDLAASPILGPEGLEGAVLTLRDRTIGRELEAYVDERTESEQFARLAAGIAHEIRNPLGGIRGAAQLLLGKIDGPDLARYPQLIESETDRIGRLLDDLSQLFGARDLELRPLNVHRAIDDLIDLQRHAEEWREVEVVREYDPSIPELYADGDRLSQVLLNLIRNAVHAMGGKGRLTARTRVDTAVQRSSGDARPIPMVRIDVLDTGPGIAPDDLPHVFTPFFTRSASGSGLGLAVARHWTVRHGGHLRALDNPEGGACLRVLLPIRGEP
jgi:two-component system nitrogen regulation sensor histidine kinase GlnL